MRSSGLALAIVAIGQLALGLQRPYQVAAPGYRYEFPRDHFNHPDFQTEWWYYTGNLTASDGHRFGFELTFFRQGTRRDSANDGVWDIADIYIAHRACRSGRQGLLPLRASKPGRARHRGSRPGLRPNLERE